MAIANSVPTVSLGDELTVSAIGFGAMALPPGTAEVVDAPHRAAAVEVQEHTEGAVWGRDGVQIGSARPIIAR